MKRAQRSLIILDETPLRKRALKSLRTVEKKVSLLQDQLETFSVQDLPFFQSWEARLFGALLTELRELSSELEEKRWILMAVEEEVFYTGCRPETAYRRIMAEKNNPGTTEDDDEDYQSHSDQKGSADSGTEESDPFHGGLLPPGFSAADYEQMSKAEKKKFRANYEMIAEMYEAMTGQTAPSLEEALGYQNRDLPPQNSNNPRKHHPSQAPQPPKSDDTYLRSLYRKLVRRLHPDANPHQSARNREIWHEVQMAYQARDVEKLELAAGRLELDLGGSPDHLPLSVLYNLEKGLKHSLRGLNKDTHLKKQHPAWNFTNRSKEHPLLEASYRSELSQRRTEFILACSHLSSEIAKLEKKAVRPRKKKSSSQKMQQSDPRDLF
jgi:hypothetical protein